MDGYYCTGGAPRYNKAPALRESEVVILLQV